MNSISIVLVVVMVAAAFPVDGWFTGDGGATWQPDCDFPGGDIGNVRVAGDQCGRACINNEQCNHFAYKDGVCYLKRRDNSYSSKVSRVYGGEKCTPCDVCGFIELRVD